MQSAVIIRGRLVGPRNVELEEPIGDLESEVEVIVRGRANTQPDQQSSLADLLRARPAGTRTRDEIDQQLHEERESWRR